MLILHPYAISRQPNGYVLTIPGEPPQLHRRKRDALSHAVQHIHTCAILR